MDAGRDDFLQRPRMEACHAGTEDLACGDGGHCSAEYLLGNVVSLNRTATTLWSLHLRLAQTI
jgi:hypothetical protein